MPFTQFTSLDFDDIKVQIKDFLRSNPKFTDFDFEGSNFSVLIDTLAYNTYINSFNANLVANESFLDTAIEYGNVLKLSRQMGYKYSPYPSSFGVCNFYSYCSTRVEEKSCFISALEVKSLFYYV